MTSLQHIKHGYDIYNLSLIGQIVKKFHGPEGSLPSEKKAAKFANHTTDSNWETLAQRGKTARMCALFKAYTGDRAWKAIGDRLQRPHYLSRVDHHRKIKNRKQRTDIGEFSFVNRTIQLWNKLPADTLGTFLCKPSIFRKRVREVIKEVK
jgi:hypothetical protein